MKPENIDAIVNEVYENYLKQEENLDDALKSFKEIAAPYTDTDGKINNRDLAKICCSFSILESRKSCLKLTAEILKRTLVDRGN